MTYTDIYTKILLSPLKENYINNNDLLNSLYNDNDNERLLSSSEYIKVQVEVQLLDF